MLINIWVLNFYIFFKSSEPITTSQPLFQIHKYDIAVSYDDLWIADYTGQVTISTQDPLLKDKTVHLIIKGVNIIKPSDLPSITNVYMTNGVGTFDIVEYCDPEEERCKKPYYEWTIIGWEILNTGSLILEEEKNDEESNMPSFLLSQYKKIFMRGDRVTAEECVKWRETIYIVSGSTGYTGETFYYTKKGKLIGTFRSSDVQEVEYFKEGNLEGTRPVKNEPPVKKEEYTCSVLKKGG